jgi:hypothetical protein
MHVPKQTSFGGSRIVVYIHAIRNRNRGRNMQFQDPYATICGTLCLPLFLLAAWGMSYRSLSKRLQYRIPLSVQARIPAIRKYWMWDLAVSGVAFTFFFLVLPIEYVVGQVFQQFVDSDGLERGHAVQPVLAFALGVFWPKVSAVSVSAGSGGQSLSLATLRDLLLGGQGIDTVNNHVEEIVGSYLRRVVDAMVSLSGPASAALQSATGIEAAQANAARNQDECDELRAILKASAVENLELLYLRVAAVKMIPLVDRPKPLMAVPSMTAWEEERLYHSGVGIPQLMLGRATNAVAPERWAELRQHARTLVTQRAMGMAAVAALMVAFVGGGLLLTPLLSTGSVKPGVQEVSPRAASERNAREAASTVYKEVVISDAPTSEGGAR